MRRILMAVYGLFLLVFAGCGSDSTPTAVQPSSCGYAIVADGGVCFRGQNLVAFEVLSTKKITATKTNPWPGETFRDGKLYGWRARTTAAVWSYQSPALKTKGVVVQAHAEVYRRGWCALEVVKR